METIPAKESEMNADIDLLIMEYIDGVASPEDVRALEDWISRSAENRDYATRTAALYTAVEGVGGESLFVPENGWKSVRDRMQRLDPQEEPRMQRNAWKWFWRSVAVSLLVGVGACLYLLIPQTYGAHSLVCLYADNGSNVRIVLPDNSVATLNADTYLSYSPNYGKSSRDLYLNGEAYIQAASNPEVPMVVHTGGLEVTVVGTTFNVRNYQDDNQAVVELEHGRVMLATVNDTCTMAPGDRAEFSKKDGIMTLKPGGIRHDSDWKSSILRFENTPLSDIARTLSRHYKADVVINDSQLKSQCYYGSFNTSSQNLDEVLSALSRIGYFDYSINGRNVIISKSKSHPSIPCLKQ